LQQAAKFTDLSDADSFNASIIEKAGDGLVGSEELVLGRPALDDFPLLGILSQGEPDREFEHRCGHRNHGENPTVTRLPSHHQQINA
jgi:hypothetical protein